MPTENFSTKVFGPYISDLRSYGQPNRYTVEQGVSSFIRGYRTSTNTPNFHDPDRTGRLKPRPFTFYSEETSGRRGHQFRITPDLKPGQYGYLNTKRSGFLNTSSGLTGREYTSVSRVITVPPSDLDSRARNGLLNKIKGSKINLAVVAAERKRTANMVGNTAMALVGAISNLRKGNFTKAAEALGVPPRRRARSRFNKQYAKDSARAVGSGWLALQYGWVPLLKDVYGACETLAYRGAQPAYVSVKSASTRIDPIDYLSSTTEQSLVDIEQWVVERKTTVNYGVTFFRSQSIASTPAQLGISNPLLVAWEVVPYSFVVDWFLPIGNWLSTHDATLGLTFYSGYRTLYSKAVTKYDKSRQGRYNNYVDDWYEAANYTEVFVKREVLTDFPSPAIPRFKNPFSVGHMLNSLALLSQSFKR